MLSLGVPARAGKAAASAARNGECQSDAMTPAYLGWPGNPTATAKPWKSPAQGTAHVLTMRPARPSSVPRPVKRIVEAMCTFSQRRTAIRRERQRDRHQHSDEGGTDVGASKGKRHSDAVGQSHFTDPTCISRPAGRPGCRRKHWKHHRYGAVETGTQELGKAAAKAPFQSLPEGASAEWCGRRQMEAPPRAMAAYQGRLGCAAGLPALAAKASIARACDDFIFGLPIGRANRSHPARDGTDPASVGPRPMCTEEDNRYHGDVEPYLPGCGPAMRQANVNRKTKQTHKRKSRQLGPENRQAEQRACHTPVSYKPCRRNRPAPYVRDAGAVCQRGGIQRRRNSDLRRQEPGAPQTHSKTIDGRPSSCYKQNNGRPKPS